MSRPEEKALSVIEDAETGNQFVVYTTASGTHLEPRFDGEEPWFTQKDLAAMYGVAVPTVNEHIKRFMDDGELDESVVRDFRITAADGKTYKVKHYGLDVAFYVGYRVNSTEGKLFRRWATQMLIQLAVHGFVVDKRRMRGDPDRLAKLREIIRDLRSDEANVYAELRQILSMCKDYDPQRKETAQFFAHFQDCLLYAIVEKTSAEIKMTANADKPNLGLQTWHEDNEYPLQSDCLTSKNYLGPLQLEDLNRLVGMVLDFFEDQVRRGWLVSMADAWGRLEDVLALNKRKMLTDFGRVTTKRAEAHAKAQYKIFDERRRAEWKAAALAELNAKAKALPRPKKLRKKEK